MDCFHLTHGISVEKDCLCDCCLMRTANNDGNPFIMNLDENNLVDWDKFFELKKTLKAPKIADTHACNGCRNLTENCDYTKDQDYVALINFNHWNKCNSRCIYCNEGAVCGSSYFNVMPLMRSLSEYKDGSYLRNYSEVTFQGGEATVLPEFEELLDFFADIEMKVRIHSNGIIFSNAIARSLSKNIVSIVISPDSAVRETYEKIKRVPCFDKTWTTIEKYAKAQAASDLVKAKFIIIAGVNDTIEEIDKFIEKCCEIGVHNVIWEIEDRYLSTYNQDVPHICMLIDYAMYKAEKAGLKDEFYDGAMYGMKNRSLPKTVITDEKAFAQEYEELKAKYQDRNIDYLLYFN